MNEDLLFNYAAVVIAMLLCLAALAVLRLRLHKRHLSMTRKITLHALQTTCLVLLILSGRKLVQDVASDYHFHQSLLNPINWATLILIAIAVLRLVFLLINLMEKNQISKGNDPTTARLISRILKIILFFIMALSLGEHFGLSLSGLMAFGGIGGIALGLASKDVLSNFFSGVMLFYDRQFNIGDWISSPDREIEGTVQEIGWRITKIQTFDKRPLYVPNSLFSSISVQNPGRMTNRRITATIGLRYDDADKIEAIVQAIRAMLAQNDQLDHTQTTLVYFNAFADSSLNIMVYCFTKTTEWAEWLEVQQEVYLKIIALVHQHGADFAFPTQTLYTVAPPSADPMTATASAVK